MKIKSADDILKLLMETEIGNRADHIYVTMEEYLALKEEFGHEFNTYMGPYGAVEIRVKDEK